MGEIDDHKRVFIYDLHATLDAAEVCQGFCDLFVRQLGQNFNRRKRRGKVVEIKLADQIALQLRIIAVWSAHERVDATL